MEITVLALGDVASTLADLAETQGVHHRDIKPPNLYRYDGRWVIGDFGLVEAPDVAPLTTGSTRLGPLHYLAPEMLLNPVSAEGGPADVWSLAKTMWVMLTGQNFPFPGPHPSTYAPALLQTLLAHPRAAELDTLLVAMTSLDPAERMSMRQVAQELSQWNHSVTPAISPADRLATIAAQAKALSRYPRDAAKVREQMDAATAAAFTRFRDRTAPLEDALQAAQLPLFRQPPGVHSGSVFDTDASDELNEADPPPDVQAPPHRRSAAILLTVDPATRLPGCALWIGVTSGNGATQLFWAGASLRYWGGRRVVLWRESRAALAGGMAEANVFDELIGLLIQKLPDTGESWLAALRDPIS